jgi:putative Mg2+ transporter-C (MgtC) family protein
MYIYDILKKIKLWRVFMIDFLMSFEVQSLIKLVLGFILAGIIGAEREALNKPAGFKTHSLIGICSVLVMLCGEYMAMTTNTDVSRIPAQLLSGIGFIGAGTILRDGLNVKGLTTAASLLAVTCIGLCIGAGFYLGGIVATFIVYIILSHSHKWFSPQPTILDNQEEIKIEEQ